MSFVYFRPRLEVTFWHRSHPPRDDLVSVRFCGQPATQSGRFSGMLVKTVSPRNTSKWGRGVDVPSHCF